jgi:antitoxin VapB
MYNGQMALHINNEKADRLARQLARQSGESITDAVITALEAQLRSGRRVPATPKQRLARMNEIVEAVSKLPIRTDLTDEEILGYDEHGLPA